MVVKAFGAEEYESRRFREASQRLLEDQLRYVLQQAIVFAADRVLSRRCTIVGLLTYARTQIKAGTMSAGDFVSFVMALLMMLEPVKRLVGHPQHFPAGDGRVAESLRIPGPHRGDRGQARRAGAAPVSSDGIVFENVSFRYPGSPDGFRARCA